MFYCFVVCVFGLCWFVLLVFLAVAYGLCVGFVLLRVDLLVCWLIGCFNSVVILNFTF